MKLNEIPNTRLGELVRDALRYRRLRTLGVAVSGTAQLDAGYVSRFTVLDNFVDKDIEAVPDRGEAKSLTLDPNDVIDRKFEILAVNPVNGKVYDETSALLICAKDAAAPDALDGYLRKCERLGCNQEHLESIRLLRERVLEFQAKAGGGRTPDTVGAELDRCLHGKDL